MKTPYRIAVGTVAAIIVMVAVVATFALSGVCLLKVTNGDSKPVQLDVLTGGQEIGSAELEPGDTMVRAFVPRIDGEIDVACRPEGKKLVESHYDYVTGGMNELYSLNVHSCSDISEKSGDWLLGRL